MSEKLFDLEGKVAVVTGGYGHLGHAMVNALHAHGALVVVAGRDESKFDARFDPDERLKFVACDIASSESFEKLFEQVSATHGAIDVVVNNAHFASGKGQEINDEDWATTLEGVLGSVHRSLRAVTPYFQKQSGGKVINVSSMYGVVSPDFQLYEGDACEKYLNPPHYGAGKAGIIQLTRYFAVALGKYNVQVNAITPGPFPKPAIQEENPAFIERLKQKNPLNRIGGPQDIGGAVVFLGSQASNFVTGHNLVIDGGWTIW